MTSILNSKFFRGHGWRRLRNPLRHPRTQPDYQNQHGRRIKDGRDTYPHNSIWLSSINYGASEFHSIP